MLHIAATWSAFSLSLSFTLSFPISAEQNNKNPGVYPKRKDKSADFSSPDVLYRRDGWSAYMGSYLFEG